MWCFVHLSFVSLSFCLYLSISFVRSCRGCRSEYEDGKAAEVERLAKELEEMRMQQKIASRDLTTS